MPTRPTFALAAGLLLVAALGAAVVVVEGLRVIREPSTVESLATPTRCELIARHEVRCTAVVDASPQEVWATITDYDSFDEIFVSGWGSMHVSATEWDAESRTQLSGHLEGRFGRWPVMVSIEHRLEEGRWVASWDEVGDRVVRNRGSWTLRPHEQGTAVTYQLEVRVLRAWRPMVNVALLRVSANVVELVRLALAPPDR